MTLSTADKVLEALRSYGLKRDGDNQWRCNSPLRAGSNSHGFRVVLHDGEHGAFDDKVSGDSGSLYDLAKALGIDVPHGAPVADTKRRYEGLADYAQAHGIDAETLKHAGWSDTIVYQGRPALPFKTKTGTRYRFIDGGSPAYKSEMGYQACWYGLGGAIDLARETTQALILCNGEISTVTAQAYGIPACAVTGGERKIPDRLLRDLKAVWDGAIWLAFDCDDTGRRAAGEIAQQIPSAVVLDLGLGDKGDLADFIMLNVDTTLDALGKLAQQAHKVPAQMTDLELLASSLDGLTRAIRKEDRTPLDIQAALATAQAQLDHMHMRAARPNVRSFKELVVEQRREAEERFQASANGISPYEIEGLRSNIPAIDDVLHGFRPEVYVIYGATGMGKTFFAVSLAREFLKQAPGFIASTELQPGRWLNRLVASLASVNTSDIRRGVYKSKEDWQRVRDAYDLLSEMNCHILDASSPTPSQIRAVVMQGLEAGYGYEWIIIDSASKMSYPGVSAIYDRTVGISNGIQDMMREFNIPVIVTSQVGRDVADRREGAKMPQLEDGYGGGTIEHNAGAVIGMYYHHYYVKRGLEAMRDDLPENVVVARFLKMRDEDDSAAPAVRLFFEPGVGIYQLHTKTINLNDDWSLT